MFDMRRVTSVICATLLMLGTAGVAQAQLFGSSTVFGTDPGSIFLIDLDTGFASLIGTPGDPDKGISDLSFDPATGALFAIHGAARRGAELLVLDPATAGVISRVAITSGIRITGSDALVFDGAGTLFVGALNPGRLLVIDPLTGVAASDTPVEGNTNLSDLAWDPTTSVLWASFGGSFPGRLVTLDPVTAQVTSVLDINQVEPITGIAFDSEGTLYGSLSGSQLVTIDKATGDVTPIGTGFGGPKIAGLGFSFSIAEGGELDHFKCYEAEGGDNFDVTVSLEDQFGFVLAEVEEAEFFCNPVDKNDEGIFDVTAHLTGYKLDDDDEDFKPLEVTVSNQFGEEQVLLIEEPKFLLVPSEKDGVTSDLKLDHFRCYEVEDGDDLDVIVSLRDQFGFALAEVEQAELFCNPVKKDGEEVLDPLAHLTCYEIEDDEVERGVLVINELPDNQFLELEEAELLCVPSEKLAVVPHGDDDDDSDSDSDRRSDDDSDSDSDSDSDRRSDDDSDSDSD